MNCSLISERHVSQWVGAASLMIPNRAGCEMISLGTQDTAGAVIVTPQTPGANNSYPIVVSARAPYIGRLEGPLLVTPVQVGEQAAQPLTPVFGVATGTENIDIVTWLRVPPQPVQRAAFFASVLPNPTSTTSVFFRVRGRRFVRVIAQTVGVATVNIDALSCQNGPLSAFLLDTTSGAGAAGVIGQFSDARNYAGTGPGAGAIDYIRVTKSADTWQLISIEAWD